MSDSVTKAYIDSIAATSSATTSGFTLSTAGNVVYGASIFTSLTPDEAKELESLEEEYRQVVKIKRINLFKGMRCALRQQIVDFIQIKNFISKLENPPEATQEFGRLFQLRAKDSNVRISAAQNWVSVDNVYDQIFMFLTEEEVMNAHAEQCLEESLLETKTDLK